MNLVQLNYRTAINKTSPVAGLFQPQAGALVQRQLGFLLHGANRHAGIDTGDTGQPSE